VTRLETAVQFLDAVNDEDLDSAFALVTGDLELVTWEGETIKGAEAARAAFEGWGLPQFDNLELERGERELAEEGDDVLVRTPVQFRWKGTGELAYQQESAVRFTFRDGRIARAAYRRPE
jgi:ketosteroid isomerase-like protein